MCIKLLIILFFKKNYFLSK